MKQIQRPSVFGWHAVTWIEIIADLSFVFVGGLMFTAIILTGNALWEHDPRLLWFYFWDVVFFVIAYRIDNWLDMRWEKRLSNPAPPLEATP